MFQYEVRHAGFAQEHDAWNPLAQNVVATSATPWVLDCVLDHPHHREELVTQHPATLSHRDVTRVSGPLISIASRTSEDALTGAHSGAQVL